MKIKNWVAIKYPSNPFGEWSVSPSAYFKKHGSIPDTHAFDGYKIAGLDEVMDHTLLATDGSDGRQSLIRAGFTIIEDPKWYFMKN